MAQAHGPRPQVIILTPWDFTRKTVRHHDLELSRRLLNEYLDESSDSFKMDSHNPLRKWALAFRTYYYNTQLSLFTETNMLLSNVHAALECDFAAQVVCVACVHGCLCLCTCVSRGHLQCAVLSICMRTPFSTAH